jgi:hypothetical protein
MCWAQLVVASMWGIPRILLWVQQSAWAERLSRILAATELVYRITVRPEGVGLRSLAWEAGCQ